MTQTDKLDLNRFAELVWAYGARPEAWPEPERDRARALLEASPEARRIAAGAAEVDRWLDTQSAPTPSGDLEARVLAAAPALASARIESPARSRRRAGLKALEGWYGRLRAAALCRPAMRPVTTAACAAIFGLLLGWGGVFSQNAVAGEEEEILAMAFVGSGLERYDLGELQ